MDVTGVGPILTLLGTFAGIWVVLLLSRWFQRDFTAEYRKELVEERKRREDAERDADAERVARQRAQLTASRLRRVLAQNGITDPTDTEQ